MEMLIVETIGRIRREQSRVAVGQFGRTRRYLAFLARGEAQLGGIAPFGLMAAAPFRGLCCE
jgi:hypothetical protein